MQRPRNSGSAKVTSKAEYTSIGDIGKGDCIDDEEEVLFLESGEPKRTDGDDGREGKDHNDHDRDREPEHEHVESLAGSDGADDISDRVASAISYPFEIVYWLTIPNPGMAIWCGAWCF